MQYDPLLTKQHLKTVIFRSYILYTKENYPSVNIEKVCEDAGLPFEYLMSDDNWVSVIFEQRFMERLKQEVQDPEYIFKVGQYGVNPQVLGKAIWFLSYNLLSLRTLYTKIPFVTSLLNKVVLIHLKSSTRNTVDYELSLNLELLSNFEADLLKSRMPDFLESIRGYYAAIPTQKSLDPSKVEIQEVKGSGDRWTVRITFPTEASIFQSWTSLFVTMSVPTVVGLLSHYNAHDSKTSWLAAISSFSLIMMFLLFRRMVMIKHIAAQTSETLLKVDHQYQALHVAQTRLSRKLAESEAITNVVADLSKIEGPEDLLKNTCESLATALGYDRSLIFIKSENAKSLDYKVGYGLNEKMAVFLKHATLELDIDSTDPKKLSNVYKTGKPILIEDVKTHLSTLIDPKSKMLLEISGSTSFVATPISTENEKFGVLVADCVQNHKTLTPDDVKVLQTVGSQLAISLEKSKAKANLVHALQQTESLSREYSKFVPFESLTHLGYKSVHDVKLGDGAEKVMTILFSDIRAFSKLCESMTPREVLKFLNSYYGRLSPIIKNHNGVIDKFIGDCIMAIFDRPADAVSAAIEIHRTLIKYNLERRLGGRKIINAGIGICQGPVIVGPLGFDGRIELTVISDTVNIASRLDGMCKDLNAKILVSGVRKENWSNENHLVFMDHGQLEVKGKAFSVPVLEIIDTNIEVAFDGHQLGPEILQYKEEHLELIKTKLKNLGNKKAS